MKRRGFLQAGMLALAGLRSADLLPKMNDESVTLFLCGDVMTGRGIDQVLPHPGDPTIHESYLKNATGYVELAERVNGAFTRPVGFDWIWGDALAVMARRQPDLRIINLETSITTSDDHWPGKGIHYRMHPDNTACISAAGIDCCVLANNHVLDWGYAGLEETLDTLEGAGISTAGAGRNLAQASSPAVLDVAGKGRVLVFSVGTWSSGVPPAWAATSERAGVYFDDISDAAAQRITGLVQAVKRPRDIVVLSIHWGGNWGYEVSEAKRNFAHRLIDEAACDLVHGHSSHHPRGIEIYRKRPIIYGCGDFLNDYEGIGGHQEYRGDLTVMYFPTIDPASGELLRFEMVPMRIRHFQLQQASREEAAFLARTMDRESRKFGARVELLENGILRLAKTDSPGLSCSQGQR